MTERQPWRGAELPPHDVAALKESAQRLLPRAHQIAVEWSRRLMQAFPEYFPPGGDVSFELITEVNQSFLEMVLRHLRDGDIKGLYESYYHLNRQLIEDDIQRAQGKRISLTSLYGSAVISFEVINEEIGLVDERLQLANAKLNAQMMMLVGCAYSDCREQHLERAVDALRKSEERARSIIDTANEAFVAIDSRGVIVDWNKQAEVTFGWRRDEAIGVRLVDTVIPPSLRDAHQRGLERFLATGEAKVLNRRIELTALRRDGSEFPVELTISPLRAEGEYLFFGLLHDITARKEAEGQLHKLTRRLQSSNSELQAFAYVASHDLQEPLRKIEGFGDRLQSRYGDALAADGRDYLARLIAAARRMRTLIDDLLTFSRVESAARPFVPVDLAELLREAVSDLELSVQQSGARIELGDLPTIEADPLQMRQLFQNLLSNALKFRCSDRTPIVRVHSKLLCPPSWHSASPAVAEQCQISVEDNGIGFEEKYAERIFGMFQRLHGRDSYPGTGVGLALCRKIAERHAGGIRAQGRPGGGATFLVTLPVKQVPGGEG